MESTWCLWWMLSHWSLYITGTMGILREIWAGRMRRSEHTGTQINFSDAWKACLRRKVSGNLNVSLCSLKHFVQLINRDYLISMWTIFEPFTKMIRVINFPPESSHEIKRDFSMLLLCLNMAGELITKMRNRTDRLRLELWIWSMLKIYPLWKHRGEFAGDLRSGNRNSENCYATHEHQLDRLLKLIFLFE